MSKIDILKLDGSNAGTLDLPSFFAVEPKKELLHQAVLMYLANSRVHTAHTKTKGEVRGGGRKPWKQKGTGRARAGSSRSPLWIGGGITFGPRKDDNYSLRLPTKMKRLAFSMALSDKAATGQLHLVDVLAVTQPKTKEVAQIVSAITPEAKSVLLVTTEIDRALFQATRNLENVAIINVADLNTYDILNFQHIIMAKDALTVLEKLFSKSEK